MWKIIIGTGIGFGIAKLLEGSKKEKSTYTPSYVISTENEKIYNYIDIEGHDWAFENLTKKDFGTNTKAWNTFQKMKSNHKDFMSVVSKIKDEEIKEEIEAILDKEGFDYALYGYTDFKKYKMPKLTQIRNQYIANREQLNKELGILE
jgi:hypothetical protein